MTDIDMELNASASRVSTVNATIRLAIIAFLKADALIVVTPSAIMYSAATLPAGYAIKVVISLLKSTPSTVAKAVFSEATSID